MAYLRNYLRSGFDPWDYVDYVEDFLNSNDIDFDESIDSEEIGEKWIQQASPEDLETFKNYIENRNPNSYIESLEPAYRHLDFRRIQNPGWLVHFTNEPWSIVKEGFIYGHEEYSGLGLTTHKTEEARKKYSGFNFAFDADSRGASDAAGSGKYGKHAVVFWGSGVVAYHWGDEESQVIFWGPSVDRNMIFALYKDSGDWEVVAENGRTMIYGKSFDEAVDWVENNYRMLQQIREKTSKPGKLANRHGKI